MKTSKLAIVVALIVATIAAAVLGVVFLGDFINLGLDLKGGVQVRIEAEGDNITADDIEKVMSIMQTRIDSLGVTEPNIQQEGDNRILIEMPGMEDPEEAINLIGQTAQLGFYSIDSEGNYVYEMDGSYLESAVETIQTSSGTYSAKSTGVGDSYVIAIQFNDEGAALFNDLTTRLVQENPTVTSDMVAEGVYTRNIAIFLDSTLISFPYVNEAIPSGDCILSGFSTLEEAHNTAVLLESGALPVPVTIIEKRTIGPTLGSDSIDKSKTACIIGLILVIIGLIAYYRVPGVVAAFSIVLYTVLLLAAMALVGSTLTLPGILGVLLSVGMCITANIIIYERLKEELAKGKTLRSSIRAAFDRALWTIVDSNVTTLIAAAVLFWKGTGSIKGFAVTLTLGIVISMFTAIVYTKLLLVNTVESGLCTNPKLFGAKELTQGKEA